MDFRIADTFTDTLGQGAECRQDHRQGEDMTEPQRFLIYQSEDGSTRIDVMLEAETLWLNQKQLTELIGNVRCWAGKKYKLRSRAMLATIP